MANAKPIPEGYHNITPYLVVKGAAAAIDFYKQVFGAVEIMRMPQPDGRVGHAELKFGDSVVMMADEFPEMDVVGPKTLGNSPVGLLLYVADVDKTVEHAVSKGATIKKPIADQFYGDRTGIEIGYAQIQRVLCGSFAAGGHCSGCQGSRRTPRECDAHVLCGRRALGG